MKALPYQTIVVANKRGGRSKMKRLLLGMILFFIPNIVYAQSAWVLWESNGDDGYLHWQVEDAFPSHDECKQARQMKCERRKDQLEVGKAIMPDIKLERVVGACPDSLTLFYKDSSKVREVVYKCFPDTIDPRK
jgi:hypothetical protein